jgi:hypothetical protein
LAQTQIELCSAEEHVEVGSETAQVPGSPLSASMHDPPYCGQREVQVVATFETWRKRHVVAVSAQSM